MSLFFAVLILLADDPPAWTQAKPGEFPAAGTGKPISGELIGLDHVNRTGTLRPDRNDAQRTDDYDIAMPFALLPYGKVLYHGSYAELRDVPIGTHLHGIFFVSDTPGRNQKPVFNRALQLEDDFSHFSRLKKSWRVESVEIDKQKLTVIGLAEDGAADPKPTVLQIVPATRVWKGNGFGTLKDLAPGMKVLANLTVCTLKGPGRCTDLWLDDESREVGRKKQFEIHKQWQREHGVGCWIDAVDNKAGTVTVTIFDVADPSILKEFKVKDGVGASVAEESLRTYDQTNDTRRGPVTDIKPIPPAPGSSGVQITFQPHPLLEGYRPKRYLRLFCGPWRIDDLPREERLYR
jgi:hypothetical protein